MSMQFGVPKHRMEALIDGVFAIAMTILVLEVKVPDLANPASGAELVHALLHHIWVIGAYFFSFALLGLFWVWHHRLAHMVKQVDGALMLCSLAFLSLVCFFPFAAALFGRYMFKGNVMVLAVYLPVVGLILFVQTLYFKLAIARGLIDPASAPEMVRSAHKRNLNSCAIYMLMSVPATLLLGLAAAAGSVVLAALLAWFAHRVR